MAKQFLQTKYNKVKKFVTENPDGTLVSEFLEVNNGPKLVDPAFVPLKHQIEQALAAGERLHAFRLGQYHAEHPDEIPENYYDPLTEPNWDHADSTRESMRIRAIAAAYLDAKKKQMDRKNDPSEPEPDVPGPIPETGPSDPEPTSDPEPIE